MCGTQIVHHLTVGGQPADTAEIVFPQPACILGLQKFEMSGKDMADIAVHREMESRIVVLHRHDEAVDRDLCVQLLTYLPPQCVLTAFALLNFAAGKLPPVFPLAIAALRGEDLVVPPPLPYDFDGIAVFDRKPFDKRPSTQTFILEKKLRRFLEQGALKLSKMQVVVIKNPR